MDNLYSQNTFWLADGSPHLAMIGSKAFDFYVTFYSKHHWPIEVQADWAMCKGVGHDFFGASD